MDNGILESIQRFISLFPAFVNMENNGKDHNGVKINRIAQLLCIYRFFMLFSSLLIGKDSAL